jgi:glycosyltransferase involved in cell wall biosynthesis
LTPADTIVCTSKAVRDAVRYQFDMADEAGWGARDAHPELPVIPLGIDTSAFADNHGTRADRRRRLGVSQDGVAVLSVGRLSVFEKMHPAPLFLALQRAAAEIAQPLHLFMCGWFPDSISERLHRAMAAEFAPDITVSFPDGRDAETCRGLYQAADLFVFPVDNIQETFGLAPVEAMAAGLPVVASDWNGIAETVVHGETGLKVPTFMAAPGSGGGMAARYADGTHSYHQYLGCVQQRVAVDVRALAQAVQALSDNPGLRRQMGAAGRRRARDVYDWAAVVPRFEAQWASQAERLRGTHPPALTRHPDEARRPPHPDPLSQYSGYASARLSGRHVLTQAAPLDKARLSRLIHLTGAAQSGYLAATPETLLRISAEIHDRTQISMDDLAASLDLSFVETEAAALRLAKYDLLQIIDQEVRQ